jgi:hypothetical protein
MLGNRYVPGTAEEYWHKLFLWRDVYLPYLAQVGALTHCKTERAAFPSSLMITAYLVIREIKAECLPLRKEQLL